MSLPPEAMVTSHLLAIPNTALTSISHLPSYSMLRPWDWRVAAGSAEWGTPEGALDRNRKLPQNNDFFYFPSKTGVQGRSASHIRSRALQSFFGFWHSGEDTFRSCYHCGCSSFQILHPSGYLSLRLNRERFLIHSKLPAREMGEVWMPGNRSESKCWAQPGGSTRPSAV